MDRDAAEHGTGFIGPITGVSGGTRSKGSVSNESLDCPLRPTANSLGAGGNGGVVEGDGVIGEGAGDAAGGTRSKVSVGPGLQKIMNHWTDPFDRREAALKNTCWRGRRNAM